MNKRQRKKQAKQEAERLFLGEAYGWTVNRKAFQTYLFGPQNMTVSLSDLTVPSVRTFSLKMGGVEVARFRGTLMRVDMSVVPVRPVREDDAHG
jgi:hypothetical protein